MARNASRKAEASTSATLVAATNAASDAASIEPRIKTLEDGLKARDKTIETLAGEVGNLSKAQKVGFAQVLEVLRFLCDKRDTNIDALLAERKQQKDIEME